VIAKCRPEREHQSAQHERDAANPAAEALRARLAVLSPTVLEIHDDGADHVGHAGAANGAGHFSLLIVAQNFSGLSRLERHQRVLREVGDLLPHPVHALSIRALAPEEFPS
jgi:BolA protein